MRDRVMACTHEEMVSLRIEAVTRISAVVTEQPPSRDREEQVLCP